MTIPATNSATSSNYLGNRDLNIETTRERETAINANGLNINLKDLIWVGLAGAGTMVTGPVAAMGLLSADQAANAIGGGAAAPAAGASTTQMSDMERIQADGFKNSTYLIQLQQEIQQENRQFTTVTNVIRAKHDTAKAALANIRS